jgi:5'-nucleotidase
LFLPFTGNLIFSEEIESIRAEVSILKNQGINKIIALGHSGFTIDKNIALEVEGIDLVNTYI